jgi:hypothetical protein
LPAAPASAVPFRLSWKSHKYQPGKTLERVQANPVEVGIPLAFRRTPDGGINADAKRQDPRKSDDNASGDAAEGGEWA